jgi:Flp pilus assembly protein TadG
MGPRRWLMGRGWSSRGAAAIEFGLTVPVMMPLAVSVFEFGMYFHEAQHVSSATYEAAIFAVWSNDPATTANTRVQAALKDRYGIDCAVVTCTITSTVTNAVTDYLTLEVGVEYEGYSTLLSMPADTHAKVVMPTMNQSP